MWNARNVHTQQNRTNKPAQRAISQKYEFFKKQNRWNISFPKRNIVRIARRRFSHERERARKSECDNIIQVTILMGALLKWLYYSSAIIAGNALHRGERFRISRAIRAEFPTDDLSWMSKSVNENYMSTTSIKFSKLHSGVVIFIPRTSIQRW